MPFMKPNEEFITIDDNLNKISDFINDMIISPRKNAHKWSELTNQTPNLKMGYPGQHLASLIVGMKGTATGARGDDIVDGTEVKSCSKVDQSDKCNNCKTTVLRSDKICPKCGSSDIKRNNDSKWLIGIRNENELRMALDETPRFLFVVTDYPDFDNKNFEDIRIRAFEVWVKSERCKNFRELLKSYYFNIYLEHIKLDEKHTPAPKNIFPDGFPFYMCNPIKTFECTILNSLSSKPEIKISKYIQPSIDREDIESEKMPASLLNKKELKILKIDPKNISNSYVNENNRNILSLRDTDKKIKIIGNKTHKSNY